MSDLKRRTFLKAASLAGLAPAAQHGAKHTYNGTADCPRETARKNTERI